MELNHDVYSDFIKSIELEKVELMSLNCEQYKIEGGNIASVDIKINIDGLETAKNKLYVPAVFQVTSSDVETEEDIFVINFKYQLTYELSLEKEDKEFDDECFQEFSRNNVPINVWPYARELVSNLASKMGFPSLIIPLYKSEFR